jgi:antitoxin MazE
MRARLIRIGNSRGIRLPKPIIQQVGLTGEIDVRIRDGAVIIRPAGQPRSGWAEAAKHMRIRGGDQLLDEPIPTRFDEKEWQWK